MAFEMQNFGDFYYPTKEIQKDLQKVTIFTENRKKRAIPNGSVFSYATDKYNPAILGTDAGCGISAYIIEQIEFCPRTRKNILQAVNEINKHIGQGNHFLDFTTGHPVNKEGNMIFLHSDFNNENIIPTTYQEAKELEFSAIEQRVSYLEKLVSLLGVDGKFYHDWTHNSVNKENELMMYRKGAIDLRKTKGIGVLALNPVDGLYLYAAEFKDYDSSMQHGTGRKNSRGQLLEQFEKETEGIAIGYHLPDEKYDDVKQAKNEAFNNIDKYLKNFGHQESSIGVCVPEYVITTKKKKR